MLAGLSIEMIAKHYHVFYFTLSIVVIILFGLMVYRKATLQNPLPLV